VNAIIVRRNVYTVADLQTYPPSYRHSRVEVEVEHLSRSKQSSAIFCNKYRRLHRQKTLPTPVFILMSKAGLKKSGGNRHFGVCQKVRLQPMCVFSLFSSASSIKSEE